MAKKPSRKTLINKLDKLVGTIVKNRGHCQKCYKKAPIVQLQTAHIYSRSNFSVRWDLDNVLCLCAGCHFWAHKNPLEFAEFVKSLLGENKYNELTKKANSIKKWTNEELIELVKQYEQLIKK